VSGEPNLSRAIVAELLPHASTYSAATAPAYGEGLDALVAASPTGWEWLEAAVLAGHLPDFAGITLAVRATHADWLRQVREAHAAGVDGEALGWTESALSYRALIQVLEQCVAEMEEERAKLLDDPVPASLQGAEAREWQAHDDGAAAEAARARALRARERRESAKRDQYGRR
jgi:hypothetical protein